MSKLNLVHKILRSHRRDGHLIPRSEILLGVDQVLIQDHSGTQAMLHLEAIGVKRVVPHVSVCYIDHNVLQLRSENSDDHLYLRSAARRYGLWLSKAGTGICHQVHLERFAVPGEVLVGADSHSTTCGGLAMFAMGAGALDVAGALAAGEFAVSVPRVIEIRLNGKLQPGCSAKDISLELLRHFGVNGGVGAMLEFTGAGVPSLGVQQRATIANMCTELGAHGGIFPSDTVTLQFLRSFHREGDFRALGPDPDANYDDSLEIDLGAIEPLVALPGSPGNVVPVKEVAGTPIHQVMIGSCTNGSLPDLQIFAAILDGRDLHPDVSVFVHPGSRASLEQLERSGSLGTLIRAGVEVSSVTCGACIGIGHVPGVGINSLRTINRNFPGRSGNPQDAVFLCSPETASVSSLFAELTDPRELVAALRLPPYGHDFGFFSASEPGLIPPLTIEESRNHSILQSGNIIGTPIGDPFTGVVSGQILIKLGDNVSTDDIMPATAEALAYRSNVPKISKYAFARIDPSFSQKAAEVDGGWIIAGGAYGQGSSREHAASAPRFLGVKGVIAKSFARLHRSNLINFGLFPLTFQDDGDYERMHVGDELLIQVNLQDERLETVVVENRTKGESYLCKADLSIREFETVRAGGRLSLLSKKISTVNGDQL